MNSGSYSNRRFYKTSYSHKLCNNIVFNTIKNMCFGYLLESPEWGDSNKYPKHMFFEEIRTKQYLCYISTCSLSILYNNKFNLMAMSLGTKAVVVTRVHCIYSQEEPQSQNVAYQWHKEKEHEKTHKKNKNKKQTKKTKKNMTDSIKAANQRKTKLPAPFPPTSDHNAR